MPAVVLEPCNVVVIVGRIARQPYVRRLASGEVSVELDLTIPGPPSETVNVVVLERGEPSEPTARTEAPVDPKGGFVAGTDVLVVGRARRRFFRVGGATQSRTEVFAERVLPAVGSDDALDAIQRAASGLLRLAGRSEE